ncbi:MAG: hypothetical protein JXA14_26340 [Anaerolineae bacterium]|nr:hypothetical protein [Anaerolineae bacterium]
MADRQRVDSLRAAHRTTRGLEVIFDKLGSAAHPRGAVYVAYRNAHRALQDVFGRQGTAMLFEVREVLGCLRRDVRQALVTAAGEAIALGLAQARAEGEAWSLPVREAPVDAASAVDPAMAALDQQIQAASAVVAMESTPGLTVLGDGTRAGLLVPTVVVGIARRYLAASSVATATRSARAGDGWGKQAVPAIDERTTDCCLRVAGQVVPFRAKFKLSGTPRFADEMDWSPFHWNCRTSVVMVPLEMAEDDLTHRLLDDAQIEIGKRRKEAEEAVEIAEWLVEQGTMPDARPRSGDSASVRAKRRALRDIHARLRAAHSGS